MNHANRKVEVIHRRSTSAPVKDATEIREEIRLVIVGVLKKLLTRPDQTDVAFTMHNETTVYSITTVEEDFGRLIGSGGKHISALRVLTLAMSSNMGFRSVIEIIDEEKYIKVR